LNPYSNKVQKKEKQKLKIKISIKKKNQVEVFIREQKTTDLPNICY